MKSREDKWQSRIDKIIQEAIEQGEFDYSSLKGKKLGTERTSLYEGDRAMAHKVLKNSGYAPDFILKKREIDDALAKHRETLLRYALRRRRLLAAAEGAEEHSQQAGLRAQAREDWAWAVRRFEEAIPGINEQIGLFNLMNQIPNLFKRKITIEQEIERVERQIDERGGAG